VKSRRSLTAAVAVVAVLGLGACAGGQPGARRLTEDMIESLDVDQSVKDCMYAVVDTYTEDELEQMGEENPQFNSAEPDLDNATPAFRQFSEDLSSCDEEG
jgi:hypothetical protein